MIDDQSVLTLVVRGLVICEPIGGGLVEFRPPRDRYRRWPQYSPAVVSRLYDLIARDMAVIPGDFSTVKVTDTGRTYLLSTYRRTR